MGGHLVYPSRIFLASLVGSHLGNIPMKLAFKANYSQFSIFSSGIHFVHQSKTILALLVEGHLSNIPMKFK